MKNSQKPSIAFLLYDGPIHNPHAQRKEVLESISELKAMLEEENLTPECKAQVENLVARGEERLR